MSAPAKDDALRPVCFMIMPYGRKATQAEAGQGPGTVNFDALWDRVYVPVLRDLGYDPVRADQDSGALIITEMVERLYFSPLVLADLTAPNGNVYYEVGMRHAMRERGCVLLAAEWARPLFDVAQLRSIRYPLPEGEVVEASALAAQRAIRAAIGELAAGRSPVHTILDGYPTLVDQTRASVIGDELRGLARFQAKTRALRALPKEQRPAGIKALVADYAPAASMPAVAHGLVRLMQDLGQWQESIDFIETLPDAVRALPLTREQQALALSKLDRHVESIAVLEELIQSKGPTSEREGLLGGRYKALFLGGHDATDTVRFLGEAIRHYELGMQLDLNDYYPTSNLPRLYRERNAEGDEARALTAAYVALAACQRASARNPQDDWIRPTLLGMAFDAVDPGRAAQLQAEIRTQGATAWMLQTSVKDLERSLALIPDGAKRTALASILEQLKTLL